MNPTKFKKTSKESLSFAIGTDWRRSLDKKSMESYSVFVRKCIESYYLAIEDERNPV